MRRTEAPIEISSFAIDGDEVFRLVLKAADYAGYEQQFKDLKIEPWALTVSPNRLVLPPEADVSNGKEFYLVVAGFRDQAVAEALSLKLSRETSTNFAVELAKVYSAPYYRVMTGPYRFIKKSVEQKVIGTGINDGWWVSRSKSMTEAVLVKSEVNEKESITANGSSEIDSSGSAVASSINNTPKTTRTTRTLRSPRPGETFVEFCVQRANAAERDQFCGDSEFLVESMQRGASLQAMSREEYYEFCGSQASRAERLQYCSDQALVEVQSRR